jgi:hypothetical protein
MTSKEVDTSHTTTLFSEEEVSAPQEVSITKSERDICLDNKASYMLHLNANILAVVTVTKRSINAICAEQD